MIENFNRISNENMVWKPEWWDFITSFVSVNTIWVSWLPSWVTLSTDDILSIQVFSSNVSTYGQSWKTYITWNHDIKVVWGNIVIATYSLVHEFDATCKFVVNTNIPRETMSHSATTLANEANQVTEISRLTSLVSILQPSTNNIERIKRSDDYSYSITYLDEGTANQRKNQEVHSSVSLWLTVTDNYIYSGSGPYLFTWTIRT